MAVVAESPDDLSVVFRTYCSQWPVFGRHYVRPPILKAHPGTAADVIGDYQAAVHDGNPEAVVSTFGPDGYFRRVNENFTRVLGYTAAELISRPFVEFVHPDDRTQTIAETAKLARGLPVVQFRNRYRDVRGGYRLFEWEAKPIPEERLIFAVARDITDRMMLECQLKSPADRNAGG